MKAEGKNAEEEKKKECRRKNWEGRQSTEEEKTERRIGIKMEGRREKSEEDRTMEHNNRKRNFRAVGIRQISTGEYSGLL